MSSTTSPWRASSHRRVQAEDLEVGDDVFMHGIVRNFSYRGRKVWVTFDSGQTHPYDHDETVLLNA